MLSGLAASLESAARHEDTEFLHENTEHFIQELSRLIRAIESTLQRAEAPENAPSDEHIAFLHTQLRELHTAMENMDAGRIDELMNSLTENQWSADIHNKLELISHNILIFEYEEAKTLILSLLP